MGTNIKTTNFANMGEYTKPNLILGKLRRLGADDVAHSEEGRQAGRGAACLFMKRRLRGASCSLPTAFE